MGSRWDRVKQSLLDQLIISKRRELHPPYSHSVNFLAAALAAVFIYWVGFGRPEPHHFRGTFFGVTAILGFLMFPARKRSPAHRPSVVDGLLILLCLVTVLYFIVEYPTMAYRTGAFTGTDLLMGLIAIAISLEFTRRVMGPILPLLAILTLVYSLRPFGQYFPGILEHRGLSLLRVTGFMWATLEGILGVVVTVYARYVFPFVILGKFLEVSGVSRFLIDLPYSVAGRSTGGPAKVAVVASALFGSISGSAVANTMATGTFTIPLMKRTGYRPHIAGAIEPAASTGGQFLPPVMGAGAFLMTEFLGISYLSIITVAFIPAIVYFISVFAMVHFEALRHRLKGLRKEELDDPWRLLRAGWYYGFPLVLLVYLLVQGYSPNFAAVWAMISTLPISWIRAETRLTPRRLFAALSQGTLDVVTVTSVAGTLGIIIGVITLTGLGIRFPHLILSLAGESVLLALILAAVAAFFLGMGVPTTASYVLMAILVVPALDRLGVPSLTSHLAVFWLTQLAGVTPPVCLVAYAGAAIAGSDPVRTGIASLQFAAFLPIMPFLFVYRPPFLLQGNPWEIAWTVLVVIVSAVCLAAAMFGFGPGAAQWPRILLFVATALLLYSHPLSDIAGLAMALMTGAAVWRLRARQTQLAT